MADVVFGMQSGNVYPYPKWKADSHEEIYSSNAEYYSEWFVTCKQDFETEYGVPFKGGMTYKIRDKSFDPKTGKFSQFEVISGNHDLVWIDREIMNKYFKPAAKSCKANPNFDTADSF